jgi:hypothetical protein
MPIDLDFPINHQTTGKHKHADGEYYHFVWGLGRSDAETSTKPGYLQVFLINVSPCK